ncbi:MAG: Crp/Fnr family transcriptional regulator [Anaerolineaceae bacterium]|nr:Crp/Fnr family transcriptional regulator [Anaerolineaceae bacterium]
MTNRRRKSPIQIDIIEPHLCDPALRFKILQMVPFFSKLSEQDLIAINQLFYEKGFEGGEYIYFSEEPAQHLFIIAEGQVKLLRHAMGSKDVLLELLVPGEFFGALSNQDNSIYPDTAQAQTAVCALAINVQDFRKILKTYSSVTIKFLDAVSDRLQSAHETIRQLSGQSAEKKISYMLLKLAKKLGQPQPVGLLIQAPLTRDDLAEMTATTPETASRVVSQFQKEGWISTGRQWIAIRDETALRSLLEQNSL